MPIYRVEVPGEGIQEVEGRPGATRVEIIAAAQQLLSAERIKEERDAYRESIRSDEPIPTFEPKDTDNFLEDIYKGLAAGAIQTLEMAALGAVAPLGEEAETSARDVIKSVADTVRPELANPEGALS